MMKDYSKKLIKIKDYLKKDVELARLGKTKERELVLLEGLTKYPNEIQLKKILLEVYFALLSSKPKVKVIKSKSWSSELVLRGRLKSKSASVFVEFKTKSKRWPNNWKSLELL